MEKILREVRTRVVLLVVFMLQKPMAKKTKRKIGATAQISWILFITFVLQKPLLFIVQYLPRYFDYIFFIYPGTASDMNGVVPNWLTKNSWFRTKIFLGVFLTKSNTGLLGRGLVVGAPIMAHDMLVKECTILTQQLEKIAICFSVEAVAFAGRSSAIFFRHIPFLGKPFVRGWKGMIFCTTIVLEAVVEKHRLSLQDANIVVFGAGNVGMGIAEFLRDKKYKVSIMTARSASSRKSDVNQHNIAKLHGADIIIAISAKGADIHCHLKNLKKGALILDGTHPKIRRPFKNGSVYRTALCLDGSQFVPPLPVYGKDSIPACVIEAMVSSIYGEITTQAEFDEKAREIGFRAYGI